MVLILGESELADDAVQVKDLEAHTQERMPREQALRVVVDRLDGRVAQRRLASAARADA